MFVRRHWALPSLLVQSLHIHQQHPPRRLKAPGVCNAAATVICSTRSPAYTGKARLRQNERQQSDFRARLITSRPWSPTEGFSSHFHEKVASVRRSTEGSPGHFWLQSSQPVCRSKPWWRHCLHNAYVMFYRHLIWRRLQLRSHHSSFTFSIIHFPPMYFHLNAIPYDVCSCRPIPNLLIASKLLERSVVRQVVRHLKSNDLLPDLHLSILVFFWDCHPARAFRHLGGCCCRRRRNWWNKRRPTSRHYKAIYCDDHWHQGSAELVLKFRYGSERNVKMSLESVRNRCGTEFNQFREMFVISSESMDN